MQAREGEIWKGPAAGIAAGLAGALAMTQVQILFGRLTETRRRGEPYNPQHSAARGTQREERLASPVMHYGFGMVTAAPPLENPPSVHTRALAAHLAYGLTTEAVRRLLRRS
jgi:hypothetical protein